MRNPLRVAAGTAVAVALASASFSASADNVAVSVNNPGGSRTLYVESMLGEPLTSLDFGAMRSQPFRVRVVDSAMDRAGFSVSATMTNLYKAEGSAVDFTTAIPSSELSVGYATSPVSAKDVTALVQPVYDLGATISGTLCTTIQALQVLNGIAPDCLIDLQDVTGKLQTVPLTADLSSLPSLPLVPQVGESGFFDNPAFAGVAATAPRPTGAPPATSKRLVQGTPLTTEAVLGRIQTALNGAVATQPLAGKVDTTVVTSLLRDELTGDVFKELSTSEVQQLVNALTATLNGLDPANILGQSGTYLSFPVLNVKVPDGTPKGDYKGTLVVTGLQS